jgi:hypothetical protein
VFPGCWILRRGVCGALKEGEVRMHRIHIREEAGREMVVYYSEAKKRAANEL